MTDEMKKRYVEQARHDYEYEGQIEFNNDPIISESLGPGDKGAYIQAWVWVDKRDLRKRRKSDGHN